MSKSLILIDIHKFEKLISKFSFAEKWLHDVRLYFKRIDAYTTFLNRNHDSVQLPGILSERYELTGKLRDAQLQLKIAQSLPKVFKQIAVKRVDKKKRILKNWYKIYSEKQVSRTLIGFVTYVNDLIGLSSQYDLDIFIFKQTQQFNKLKVGSDDSIHEMRKESKVLIYLLRGYPNLRDCKPLLLLKDKLVYCAKKLGKRNDLRKAYSNFQDKVKEKSITLSSSSKNKLENLLSIAQTIKVTILEEIKLLNLRL